MPRCFIGIKVIWPGYEKFKYELIKKELIFGKWVENSNLHLTLKFLGEISIETLEHLKDALEKHNLKKFKVKFHSLGCFPNCQNPRVLFIKVEGNFFPIKSFIEETCFNFNFEKDNKEFIPHLTLVRIKKLRRKNLFLKLINEYQNKEFFSMEVKEFQFFESKLTSYGPIYKILKSYSLK